MAIPTSVATGSGSGSVSTTGVLSDITVAVGDVVVLRVSETDGNGRSVTPSDSLGHTWTLRQTALNSRKVFIYTTTVTTAGTMTITTAWNLAATWLSFANAIRDSDGAAAFDAGDQFTQTATSCFAAPSTAIDTAANVIVLAVYAINPARTWTVGIGYASDSSGAGYLFQSRSSALALVDERAPATHNSSPLASAAAVISIKGSSGSIKYTQLERSIRGLNRGLAPGLAH